MEDFITTIVGGTLGLILVAGVIALVSFLLMVCWNFAMVGAFDLPPITFIQSFVLLIIFRLLLGFGRRD